MHQRRYLLEFREIEPDWLPVKVLESHRHLFKAGISRPLTYSVDRRVDCGGAIFQPRDRGGNAEAEVVVCMDLQRFLDVTPDDLYESPEGLRGGAPESI